MSVYRILPTAQVAYQQGKYLANQFNHKLTNTNIKTNINTKIKSNEFVFENKGQFCYIGKNKSVFHFLNPLIYMLLL
jgi:NADH dehydrogenase FAD-containing subunit